MRPGRARIADLSAANTVPCVVIHHVPCPLQLSLTGRHPFALGRIMSNFRLDVPTTLDPAAATAISQIRQSYPVSTTTRRNAKKFEAMIGKLTAKLESTYDLDE